MEGTNRRKPRDVRPRESGFTLIELSIVLVIIGLIVGGVLIGQDLIKAAEVRAAISQIEKYDAAASTFRSKYNGLPGDLNSPANFGFNNTGLNAAQAGNGLLNRSNDASAAAFDQEAAAFFRHLGQANMVAEPITGTNFTAADAAVTGITNYAPALKLGRGAMVMATSRGGQNSFVLGGVTLANGALGFNINASLAVIDAFNIDTKLDDGHPVNGRVVAVKDLVALADTNPNGTANNGAADNFCVNTAGAGSYQTDTTARQTDTECTIALRASF